CISRQLWWGQQIPAYYLPDGGFVVAETVDEALELAREKSGNNNLQISDLRQDADVLDTWFSSWLWPISVFDGIRYPDNEDIKYYYPTNVLVTAPDIIFFWVARMIMMGYEYRSEKPFRNVYFTGLVRDHQRRKMSKQLGNSPDPLDLIEKYGADGVRVAMMLCSSAGNALMFAESLCEQGRNFGNKIWNAYRLVDSWECDPSAARPESSRIAMEWFRSVISHAQQAIESDFAVYRISEALMTTYKLFWDDFSGWLLEMIKPPYGSGIDPATLEEVKEIFEKLLLMLHPFMPFITEEIWQNIRPREEGQSIMLAVLPEAATPDTELMAGIGRVQEVVSAVRAVRKQKNFPNREQIRLAVIPDGNYPAAYESVLAKMANLEGIDKISEKVPDAVSFIVKTTQYFIPLANAIDKDAELKKLREELSYYEGFLKSVMGKLGNERFVANAPKQVVENEMAKKNDAQAKIEAIKLQIEALNG
ncbi:MAG: class I tRNA ligase family protein, partial [Alistipes sp.]|nr:class I tRNA ligase family protein [Alistipes sp.]